MRTSEQINELAGALAKAQASMKAIKRNSKVTIKTRSGSSYSYDYATLDNVIECTRKPLSENGIALIQAPSFTDGGLELVTRLIHESGQWIECALSIQPENNEIKTLGSVITYLRRYAYTAMVGVASDEDTDTANDQTNIKPATNKPKQNGSKQPSQQAQAQTQLFADIQEQCQLNEKTARLICNALKIKIDDPSKYPEVIKTLCQETAEPSCMPSLIVAANRKTGYYYARDKTDVMKNVFHLKGSVEKMNPDIVWPNPGNPKAWAEHLSLAVEYATNEKINEQRATEENEPLFPLEETETNYVSQGEAA